MNEKETEPSLEARGPHPRQKPTPFDDCLNVFLLKNKSKSKKTNPVSHGPRQKERMSQFKVDPNNQASEALTQVSGTLTQASEAVAQASQAVAQANRALVTGNVGLEQRPLVVAGYNAQSDHRHSFFYILNEEPDERHKLSYILS